MSLKRWMTWALSVGFASSGSLSLRGALEPAVSANGYCGVVASHPLTGLTPDASAAAVSTNWTHGTKRVLYYRVAFTDATLEPDSVEEAEESLAEANTIFQRCSFGKYSIAWTITPLLHLPRAAADYTADAGRDMLLEDSRAAAKTAGIDYEAYDLDVVRHHPVPGYMGGYGRIGQRGAWLQSTSAFIIVHEIGHNLGLHHANFWDTSGPDSSPKISPPFPTGTNEGREGHPFDPGSLIGHDSMIGPGKSLEYGDPFDLMGGGNASHDFNALSKHKLGWLEDDAITAATASGTYRVYAYDMSKIVPGHSYGLRINRESIAGSGGRWYWLQLATRDEGHEAAGQVRLHWADGLRQSGVSLLIDTTPGSGERQGDAALDLGRTFTDLFSDIHITPVARGRTEDVAWVDVNIQLGPFPTNVSPTLSLETDALQVEPGTPVRFAADARDPNGDPLVYAWTLSDGQKAGNTNAVEIIWKRDADYVVRCEVSDMRGGVASRHLVVRVGSPDTWRISGRVIDGTGQPVQGVRVHNGRVFRNASDGVYVWTQTDSAGAYTLSGLSSGSYTNGAFLHGYRAVPAFSDAPLVLVDRSVTNADFIAESLPRITVRVTSTVIAEGGAAEFVFSRTGPANKPLAIPFVVSGTAQARVDYPGFLVNRVTIPAGALSASLPVFTFADGEPEGKETITLRALLPSESTRARTETDGTTNEFTVFYPGWELLPQDGQMLWHQTYPDYFVTAESMATLTVEDGSDPSHYRVSVHASSIPALESPLQDSSFTISREGSIAESLTVFYALGGRAENGIDFSRLPGSVEIPQGEDFVVIPVTPIPDDLAEGAEDVVITLLARADYSVLEGEASLTIRDDASLASVLSIRALIDGSLELSLTASVGKRYVLEESEDLAAWLPTRTNLLFASPLTFKLPPPSERSARFYRTFVQP